MKLHVGLWIDHRQAVIVHLFKHGETTIRIASDLPPKVRFSGVSHNHAEAHDDFAEDRRDRRFEEMLNHYYDNVIAEIADARDIFIMGPGEAKTELAKRLERDELASHIVAVETADKMTDNQIVAKVRAVFEETTLTQLNADK